MMQEFKRVPEPLQKQILLRLGLGAVFMILLIAMLITAQDLSLLLPCAGLAVFFAAGAFTLFRRVVLGEYVVVSGICTEVENTLLKRRAKHIILDTGDQAVRIALGQRRKRIAVGAAFDLYLASSARIYEKDGALQVFSYLALEKKTG